MRPHVIGDLWDTCLFEYQRAVVRCFASDTFGDLDDLEGYFKVKQAEFEKVPRESPNFIVARIQRKLAPGGPGSSPERVRTAFRLWRFLNVKETHDLHNAILIWSKKWNLKADWCRDHALAVLREWLFHDFFKWLHITPQSKDALQRTGWSLALHDIEGNAVLGQVLADELLHGSGKKPEVFRFSSEGWLGDDFEVAWNAIDESEIEFKKRARISFRITLGLVELNRLRPLAENEAARRSLKMREFENELAWRSGILKDFESSLQRYIKEIGQLKQQAKERQGVSESRPALKEETLKWLVLYQIPQEDSKCLSYAKIREAEAAGLTEVRIRQSVKAAAELVALRLRDPSLNAGRPRVNQLAGD